jgi:uncharacterized membrane protein YphA (DoxX/SURF4 family)
MRKWLLNPKLSLRIQIALGLVFIFSASTKLADPPAFAKAIWNYKLLPLWAVNPLALILPWLELICGLVLVIGCWVRAAGAWITALLSVFILALSLNLARHRPVDCGCFSLGEAPKSEAERLRDMRWAILRDLGLLLLALQILAASRRPE